MTCVTGLGSVRSMPTTKAMSDGEAPALLERLRLDDVRRLQEEHHEGQLEEQRHAEHHGEARGDVVLDAEVGRHVHPDVPPDEEAQAEGDEDQVGDREPEHEEDEADREEDADDAPLVLVEAGGDEAPQLPQHDRRRDHRPREEAELERPEEPVAGPDRLQRRIAHALKRGRLVEGAPDELPDRLPEDEGHRHRDEEGEDGAHETNAQLVQVLRKGHPGQGGVGIG